MPISLLAIILLLALVATVGFVTVGRLDKIAGGLLAVILLVMLLVSTGVIK